MYIYKHIYIHIYIYIYIYNYSGKFLIFREQLKNYAT